MIDQLTKALDILKNEGVIAIPTETVYGLAGMISSEKAINKIFKVKERPFFDPLIVHISSLEMAKVQASNWTPLMDKLAKSFWPGPMTMVVDKSKSINPLITSGLDKVGIRMPNHPLTLELISTLNTPLAAPSANKFTKTSPTKPLHVNDEFGDSVFVLDGGDCQIGIESTVLGVFEDRIEIYRPGMLTKEQIQDELKENFNHILVEYKESPVAPGQLKHHYMPKKPVTITTKLNKDNLNSTWIVPDSPELAARQLYAKLRELDQVQSATITIVLEDKFKNDERFKGILNRLEKAKTIDEYFI